MRILMIEDNPDSAYLARFLLEQRGHDVFVAETGASGIACAIATDYDAVLLDIRLPDGDGCDFVPHLSRPGAPFVPVVAISAHAMAIDHQRAKQVGCVGFIDKPIDVATFVDDVENLTFPAVR